MGQAVGRGVNPQCLRSGAGGITWDAVQQSGHTMQAADTHGCKTILLLMPTITKERNDLFQQFPAAWRPNWHSTNVHGLSLQIFSVKFWTDRLWSLGILQTFQKQLAIFLQSSKQICYSSKWDVTKSYRFNALENGTPPIHSEEAQ